MEKTGLFYVRFMDDWIVLSPNRWKLKKAIQIVNQTLNELKVEKHPDKTFIGRIAKGFDFLGYSFEPKGLSIAPKTLANFLERKTQLYEQGAARRFSYGYLFTPKIITIFFSVPDIAYPNVLFETTK